MRLHEPISGAHWQARLKLAYDLRDGSSVLSQRTHHGPLLVQKSLYPEGGAVCHHVILHPPGGIAGGDRLELEVAVGPGAAALLTTPGAGKWYRSKGPAASQVLEFAVAAGGVLEWVPQENILFDAAVAHLDMQVALTQDAAFIGWELICFGRTVAGETFQRGQYRPRARIRRNGVLLWQEQGGIAGGSSLFESAVGLGGQPVYGTLVAAGPGLNGALLAACRTMAPIVGTGSVTLLPEVLVARYLGPDAAAGRAYFVALWQVLRPVLTGRAVVLPRIWAT
ncbi:MAG: urease accessory protein UreD [Burkholderiales bacterium]|nr:urease accessory protein [Ferrovum sp.]